MTADALMSRHTGLTCGSRPRREPGCGPDPSDMLMGVAAIPETVYARDGDLHLAYQIVGDREPDDLRGHQSAPRSVRAVPVGAGSQREWLWGS
jgi:hypothetical protein